jgi:hypothetical protein
MKIDLPSAEDIDRYCDELKAQEAAARRERLLELFTASALTGLLANEGLYHSNSGDDLRHRALHHGEEMTKLFLGEN